MSTGSLFRRRVAICTAFAAATGIVAVVLVAIADHVALMVLRDASTQPFEFTSRVIARVAERTSLPLSSSPLVAAALGVTTLAMLGAAAGALLHGLRLDPQNHVGRSLAWAWRAMRSAWPATLTLAALAAAFFGTARVLTDDVRMPAALLAVVALTLGILSPRTAASERGERWWLPQWPGWQCSAVAAALLAAIGLMLCCTYFVNELFRAEGGAAFQPSRFVIVFGLYAFTEILVLAFVATLVLRWRFGNLTRDSRALLRRDIVLPWFVGAAAGYFTLPLELIAYAADTYETHVRPQSEAFAEAGQAIASLETWSVAVRWIDAAASTGACLLVVLLSLMSARLVRTTLGEHEPLIAATPIELPAARVETPADHS